MTSQDILKLCMVALAFALSACERGTEATATVSFTTDVQPILNRNCVECHDKAAEGVAASGLNLADYDGLMQGTRYGPMVVPDNSESSSLYLVIAQKTSPEIRMPPQHEDAFAEGRGRPLSEKEIQTIKTWIDEGALNN